MKSEPKEFPYRGHCWYVPVLLRCFLTLEAKPLAANDLRCLDDVWQNPKIQAHTQKTRRTQTQRDTQTQIMRDSVENSSSLFNSPPVGGLANVGGRIYERGKDTTLPLSLLSVAAISGSQIRELLSRSHEMFDVYYVYVYKTESALQILSPSLNFPKNKTINIQILFQRASFFSCLNVCPSCLRGVLWFKI